jgi:hypothetical protein
MSAGLIREMQVNISKYGKTNVTTLLMVQAVKELQGANAERDRLKAANAELAEALERIVALRGTENDEWDGVDRVIPEMCEIARAALTKHQGAAA